MIPDYHIHTRLSGDNQADPEACCQRAIALGMDEICLTEHLELQECSFLKGKLDLREYRLMVSELRGKYGSQLNILMGIEFGFYEGCRGTVLDLIKEFEPDFMIGSVHYVDDVSVAYAPELYPYFETIEGPSRILKPYFQALEQAADTGLFSVIGHADLIFTHAMVHFRDLNWDQWQGELNAVVRALIRTGTGLEINTGGLVRGFPDTTPESRFLRTYLEAGGTRITFGSDAHQPQEIGGAFDRAMAIAGELGFRNYSRFSGMKEKIIRLP